MKTYKTHKTYIISLILLMIFSLGCENPDDFLDVKPTGILIPETLQDFEGLFRNYAYSRSRVINLDYVDPDVFMSDLTYGFLSNEDDILAYQWNSELYNADQTDPDYNTPYSYIYLSNFILPLVDDAPEANFNPANRSNIKAEAYAQRAMEFFLLVNEYAHHYDSSNPDIPGVALPVVTDLSAELSRSTVGEVYALILSDLEMARDLFNDDHPVIRTDGNYRPGKASVYALLAEVNLYMGNFEQAKINSDIALSMYDYLYNYNDIDFYDTSNVWNGYNITDLEYATTNKQVIWNRYNKWGFNNPIQLYHPELEALYDKVNDRRWYLHATQTTSGGTDVAPYHIFFFASAERNVGLTVPRLLLTNAEAKVRSGDGAGAITSLNKLLANRMVSFTPLTHSNDGATLQLIKDERRKELHGSSLNVFDQKRYHVLGENVPTYTRTIPISGENITLEPGGDGYVIDIPLIVRNINPNLN